MANIFVYGTLRPSLYPGRRIAGKKVRGATLRSNFQMYNLGSFPALVEIEGEQVIVGETFEIPDPDKNGSLVYDGYEGYSPSGNGLYDRRLVNIVAEDGEELQAWVYFQHRCARHGGELVPSNDWADIVNRVNRGGAFYRGKDWKAESNPTTEYGAGK